MAIFDFVFHALNFAAPAAAVTVLMVLAGRFLERKVAKTPVWQAQAAINFIVCMMVLLLGLWFFGNDGKMATYAALVLACACSQWAMLRGWRA
jgi:type III secretory pathway component EscT